MLGESKRDPGGA
ncbi:hypothetical protein Zm00014a_013399 [Zea mays]|uniref:Uncharacterized protein n=2 Tax=Zea mays TaxID=4577 RepID=A0A3L6FU74_MAIZE|nr:hypothetical protein Zm00014a_013400 [Zea mays]PWZ41664.1 hypothetical protein Zm00014a_013399 [Zea mays]